MNPLLNRKLTELEEARDYECWYLVKQPTDFDKLCYLVSFLKQFQDGSVIISLNQQTLDTSEVALI